MSSTHYDYIVVGCGGIGSGALYWLSRRPGKRVLGLEQFKLAHENGGSQDYSRIIRLMYVHEKYTKIVRDSYAAWHEVEAESGIQLVYKTGSLDLAEKGTSGEATLQEYAKAMKANDIPFEELSAADLSARFPQWQVPEGAGVRALYQADGGLVDAAAANAVHVQLARARGAEVLEECTVQKLEPTPDGGCKVHTNKGVFTCARVIVTAGAWINHVLGSVGVHIPVLVSQEQVSYFATPHIRDYTKARFPVYIFHLPEYDIYGLPAHGLTGSKVGVDAGGPAVRPDTRTFTPDPARLDVVTQFCQKYLPSSLGPEMLTKTCLYTMTLDRDFVVDSLAPRGMPGIIVCCGAGHAYKWASLLGKILSEMAVDGSTQYDIRAFTMDRPAITDPEWVIPDHGLGIHAGKKGTIATAGSSKL